MPLTTIVEYNNIMGNTQYGIDNSYFSSEYVLKAENNWWGDATGPSLEEGLGGLGDKVSDHVDYDPWLGNKCEKMEITGAVTGRFPFDVSGMVLEEIQASSDDGKTDVHNPLRYYMYMDGSGDPVYGIGVSSDTENTFDGSIISLEFTPDGTHFFQFYNAVLLLRGIPY